MDRVELVWALPLLAAFRRGHSLSVLRIFPGQELTNVQQYFTPV